jgi:hypothetical protein
MKPQLVKYDRHLTQDQATDRFRDTYQGQASVAIGPDTCRDCQVRA